MIEFTCRQPNKCREPKTRRNPLSRAMKMNIKQGKLWYKQAIMLAKKSRRKFREYPTKSRALQAQETLKEKHFLVAIVNGRNKNNVGYGLVAQSLVRGM